MTHASPDRGNARTLRWTGADALAWRLRRHGGLDFFRAVARGDIPQAPVHAIADMRLTGAEPGYSRFEWDPGPHTLNPMGGVHGGAYALLLESAAGAAARAGAEAGLALRAVRLNVDFLRPLAAGAGTVVCEGRTVKPGRRIVLADAAMADRQGRETGRAQAVFAAAPAEDSALPSGEPPPFVESEYRAEWGDLGATRRASAGKTGFELMFGGEQDGPPANPFGQTLGFAFASAGDGEVVIVSDPAERQRDATGRIHNGVAATLIDSATGCAFLTTLPAGYIFSTVSLTCDFFRPVGLDTGPLTCTGRVVERGSDLSVADAAVTGPDGAVHARGAAVCVALPIPPDAGGGGG